MRGRVLTLLLVMLVGTGAAWAGTSYVDFNDDTSGDWYAGNIIGDVNSYVTISGGTIKLGNTAPPSGFSGMMNRPGTGGWNSEFYSGDFTVELTLQDITEVSSGSNGTYLAIMLWDGVNMAFCGPVVAPDVPDHTGIGINPGDFLSTLLTAGYVVMDPGEACTATTRSSTRVVRSGRNVELWMAYDGNATVGTTPGTFHLVTTWTDFWAAADTPVAPIIVGADAVNPCEFTIDDLYISGGEIADYPPLPPDSDGDGVPDASDAFPYDARYQTDTDADGLADEFENACWGDTTTTDDPNEDYDGDTFTNLEEQSAGTNANDVNDFPAVLAPVSTTVVIGIIAVAVLAFAGLVLRRRLART